MLSKHVYEWIPPPQNSTECLFLPHPGNKIKMLSLLIILSSFDCVKYICLKCLWHTKYRDNE